MAAAGSDGSTNTSQKRTPSRFIRRPKALDGRQQAIGNRAIGAREDEHAGAHAAADVQRIGRPAVEIDAARTLRGHRPGSKKNRERHTRPQGAAHNEESIGLPGAPRSHLDWGTGRHRSAADGVARRRFDGPAPRAQPPAASAWSLHPPAARLDRARRLAAPPARDSGQRSDRSARRVLARRRRTERLAWWARRKLGARPLLSRRPPAAGVSARERRADRQGEPVRRVDAHPPATERMARTAGEHRLVAEHGDAEGPDAVPGGHRRSPRRACVDPLLSPSPRRGRAASAEGLGNLSMGRRARLDRLAVQPHRRSEAADACPNAAQPGHRLAPALRDARAHLEDDHAAARVGCRAEGPSGSRDARARRQQRDGAEDVGDLVAAVRRARRSRCRPQRTRRARSLSRAAERHVQRRRALCGPRSVGRHRAVRGGRGDVLDRAEPRRAGRRAAGRSSGADRLQRAAGHALGRHVVAPVPISRPIRCCAA